MASIGITNSPTLIIASTASLLLNEYCIWNSSGGKTLASKFSSWISPRIPLCFWFPKIFSSVFIWFAKVRTCSLVPLIFSSSLVNLFIVSENLTSIFFWSCLESWSCLFKFSEEVNLNASIKDSSLDSISLLLSKLFYKKTLNTWGFFWICELI